MNKCTPIIASVVILATSISFSQLPSPTASIGGPPCKLSSRDVDLYGFYGSKEIVGERVSNLPINLPERRLFLQITQAGRADDPDTEVKLFERQKDGSLAVTAWTKVKASGLFAEIDRAIIENKGKNCVGEAIKAVLVKRLGPGKPAPSLAGSASPKDAFAPSVEAVSDDFLKSVVILGC